MSFLSNNYNYREMVNPFEYNETDSYSSKLDMRKIKGHINVVKSPLEIREYTELATGQFVSRINQSMGVQVDECVADEIFKMMISRLERVPIVKHECHSCGATLEIDADKHIFVCSYCGACYAIGVNRINAR